MKLRTFTASNMQAAMSLVRAALGENAVILSSKTDRASKHVTLTAAIEHEDEPIPTRGGAEALATNAAGAAWMDELAFLLRYHGVPEALAGRMVYKARSLGLEKIFALKPDDAPKKEMEATALARLMEAFFHFAPLELQSGHRLMLVGPSGVGKTLALAKLAAQAVVANLSVAVLTTDNARAGGIEQLSAFTDILELPLHIAEDADGLRNTIQSIPPSTLALIDTGGCNPYDGEALHALHILVQAANAEPVLALPAGIDSYEAADTCRAFAFPAIKRLLMTRTDAARRYGALLAAAEARSLAFAGASADARVVEEISPLDAKGLARMLLESHLQTG